MTVETLKNAKLCPMTEGYLAIYLKLSDLYGEASDVTEIGYEGPVIDKVNEGFTNALSKAQHEIMNLAVMSMTENLLAISNTTEL